MTASLRVQTACVAWLFVDASLLELRSSRIDQRTASDDQSMKRAGLRPPPLPPPDARRGLWFHGFVPDGASSTSIR